MGVAVVLALWFAMACVGAEAVATTNNTPASSPGWPAAARPFATQEALRPEASPPLTLASLNGLSSPTAFTEDTHETPTSVEDDDIFLPVVLLLPGSMGEEAASPAENPLPAATEESQQTADKTHANRGVASFHVAERAVGPWTLSARRDWQTSETGFYLNNHEVMRFRATDANGQTPWQQAQHTLHNFQQALTPLARPGKQTPAPRFDYAPSADAHLVGVKLNGAPLYEVSQAEAVLRKMTPMGLARCWAEQIHSQLAIAAHGSRVVAKKPPATTPIAQKPQEKPLAVGTSLVMRGHVAAHRLSAPLATSLGTGFASWYGPGFHGRRAANGSRFDMNALTAAHRTLPFGTKVRVSNTRNGQACVVTITDRGPYIGNRIIDLSKAAAAALGMLSSGVSRVSLEVLSLTSRW